MPLLVPKVPTFWNSVGKYHRARGEGPIVKR